MFAIDKLILISSKYFVRVIVIGYLFFASCVGINTCTATDINELATNASNNLYKQALFFSLAEYPIKLAHYFSAATNNLVIDILQTDNPSPPQALPANISDNLLIDLCNHDWHNIGIEYSLNFHNSKIPIKSGILRQKSSNCLRIICNLEDNVEYNIFLTAATAMLPQYLVVETVKTSSQVLAKNAEDYYLRDIIIVIDPGHGGVDPGCINYQSNILEKDINFSIANKLMILLNTQHGFKAILTRSNDSYIKLQERVQIAQNNRADLFVSIHADGSTNTKACGFSVFVISPESAAIEKQKIDEEINFKINLLAMSDWLDIDKYHWQQNSNSKFSLLQSSSYEVATKILASLAKIGTLHHKQVYNESFAVLKSLHTPSVLIESGFLTNANEATKLANDQHQHTLAQAIATAILEWFNANPPLYTLQMKVHDFRAK